MRILHISPTFYPAWSYGGVPRAVYEIARAQVESGHSVSVITTDAYQEDEVSTNLRETVEGIEILRVRNLANSIMWKFHTVTPFKDRFPNLANYEVIHVHEYRTFLSWLAVKNIKKDQKLIFSPWGTVPYNNTLSSYKKLFEKLFLNSFKSRVDLSLGQTNHEVEVLKEFNIGKKSELLPVGIDMSFFQGLPDKNVSRKEFGLNKEEFVVLFLGRFSKVKVGSLLKSFEAFSEKVTSAKLFLVGRDDGYLKELEEEIVNLKLSGKVVLAGPLYDKERLKAYVSADVFVFTPSVYEETSTACLEALACGIPVVTTQEAEIPYLKESDGVWQAENSLSGVVAALEKAYSAKNLRVNRAELKKRFDWLSLAGILVNYYESI